MVHNWEENWGVEEAVLCLKLAHVDLAWVMLALVLLFLMMIPEEGEALGKEEDQQDLHFYPGKTQVAEGACKQEDYFHFFLESNHMPGHWTCLEMDW